MIPAAAVPSPPGGLRRLALLSALALVASGTRPARAGETKIRPGRYAIHTETTMERGGESRALPATDEDHCFAAADLEDYRKILQGRRDRDCETTEAKRHGDRVSWSVRCKSGASGTWEMREGAARFELTIEMSTPGAPHGPAAMKIHTTATRTGDCPR